MPHLWQTIIIDAHHHLHVAGHSNGNIFHILNQPSNPPSNAKIIRLLLPATLSHNPQLVSAITNIFGGHIHTFIKRKFTYWPFHWSALLPTAFIATLLSAIAMIITHIAISWQTQSIVATANRHTPNTQIASPPPTRITQTSLLQPVASHILTPTTITLSRDKTNTLTGLVHHQNMPQLEKWHIQHPDIQLSCKLYSSNAHKCTVTEQNDTH